MQVTPAYHRALKCKVGQRSPDSRSKRPREFRTAIDGLPGYAVKEPAPFKTVREVFRGWMRLGAREIGGQHAYSMPVPLLLKPLLAVKHHSRAIARRRHWLEIALSARRTVLDHRMSPVPASLEAEAEGLMRLWESGESEEATQSQG